MFGRLFKNKTNTEAAEFTITHCVCGGDSERCDLIIQLRKCQDLRKEIKGQIEALNKDGCELLANFMDFLKRVGVHGARIDGFHDNYFVDRNMKAIERTICDCSYGYIFRMTEELKTYRNKADIISEKQRALKAVEDDISDIKFKLGIE